jgi:serine/threonine protein kinase
VTVIGLQIALGGRRAALLRAGPLWYFETVTAPVSAPVTPYCPECGASSAPPSDGALRCPTHDLFLIAVSEAAHLDDHPLLGQVLDGKYALTSVVGSGGFGAVYGGLQLPLNRPVAVKVLLGTSFTKKIVRDRFEREALSLARLRSEHTVRLLDFGVCRDTAPATRNLPYLVMELIDGVPLHAYHEQSPLSLAQMADLVDDVAESLAEAHARGIVHRDLKPSNVLLTRDFQGRTLAKVIDFGIARVEDAARSEAGLVSGTPRYMAPEQARSQAELDGRVDVYALGIILYELITGRVPFVHDLPMVVLQMQVADEVPSFAARGVTTAQGAVEAVVRRALAKTPGERFETPLALASAFRAAVASLESAASATRSVVGSSGTPGVPVTPGAPATPGTPEFLEAETLPPPPLAPPAPLAAASSPAVAAFETLTASAAPAFRPPPASPAPARSRFRRAAVPVAVVGGAGLLWALWPSDPDARPVAADARAVAMPAVASAALPPRPRPAPATPTIGQSAPIVSGGLPSVTVAGNADGPATANLSPVAGPTRPRSAPPRAPAPDAAARELASKADGALRSCRCAAADAAIRALVDHPGGSTLATALRSRLATCRNIDPDHRCVDGRLEEIE